MKQSFDPKRVSSAQAWQRFHRLLMRRFNKLSKNINKLKLGSRRHSIHQLRVLSRRLRAMLGILKKTPVKFRFKAAARAVKKLTRLLSPIRSLDVSSALFQTRLKQLSRGPRGRLRGCEAALRDLRRAVRKALPTSTKSLRKTLVLPHGPKAGEGAGFLPALQRQIEAASGRAARALAAYQAKPAIPKLHEFRIQLKKYRYLLETRSELLKTPNPRLTKLKELQDEIGAIHDLEVLKQLLENPSVSREARTVEARKELQDFLAGLESEIEAGERNFLPRRRKLLKSIFPRKDA